MTPGIVIGWVADPGQGPKTPAQFLLGIPFMFALWSINIGCGLSLFAGVPWTLLHLIGARSFWVAPVTGFVVAFGLAFYHTWSIGHPDPRLDTSMWEPDGTPIITCSRLLVRRSTTPGRR